MTANNIRAVIWDMGGVILRTENKAPRQKLASQYGISLEALEDLVFNSESAQLAHVGKITEKEHWQNIANHFKLKDEEELKHFRRAFWGGDRVDAELVDYIRALRPQYKTGLLSNAWQDTRRLITLHHDFLGAFDVSIFSAEVGLAKPDARFYHLILKELGVSPVEAVFIDDVIENIEGAMAVGMHAIHFADRQQTLQELQALLDGNLTRSA